MNTADKRAHKILDKIAKFEIDLLIKIEHVAPWSRKILQTLGDYMVGTLTCSSSYKTSVKKKVLDSGSYIFALFKTYDLQIWQVYSILRRIFPKWAPSRWRVDLLLDKASYMQTLVFILTIITNVKFVFVSRSRFPVVLIPPVVSFTPKGRPKN